MCLEPRVTQWKRRYRVCSTKILETGDLPNQLGGPESLLTK